jgi:seryl-tRNA synthetase
LKNRNFPLESLDDFVRFDAETRAQYRRSRQNQPNSQASSKEIGALVQSGKKTEADRKKAEVASLKTRADRA